MNNIITWLKEYAAIQRQDPDSFHTGWSGSRATAAGNLESALVKREALAVTGYSRFILIFGLHTLPEEKLTTFAHTWAEGGKSHSNEALRCLEGVLATIMLAKSGSAWIVQLGQGDPLHVLDGSWKTIPCQNTSNGAGHWIALCTKSLAAERLAKFASGQGKLHPSKEAILRSIAMNV